MMSLELFQFQMYHLKEMSLSTELFLSCSILQFTFYALSTAYQRKAGFIILSSQVYYIGSLLIILSFFLTLNEDLLVTNSFSSNNFIINDYFSFVSKLVVCSTSILFLLLTNISFRDEPTQNNFEYIVLVTISILGLLLLCSANDLITAYLAIELHSIAFYIMAAFKRNSSYSIESGLKYFIIGALSSALFLFGSAIVYGCMGSLRFDDIQLFLSLLFSSNLENVSTMSLGLSQDYSVSEIIFGKYSFIAGESLLNIIAMSSESSVSLPVTYSIALDTNDSLIDWCNTHRFTNSSLIFPTTIVTSSLLEYSNIAVTAQNLYTQQVGVSLIGISNTLFNGSMWLSLLSCDKTEFGINLLLVKYIFDLYTCTGTIDFVSQSSLLDTQFLSIGFILICISVFIKLSIAPFHYWSLDVYEGSPNITTFFFAVAPKIALFILLFRLCYMSFYPIFITNFQVYFFILAVLSVFVGSVGGLEQRKLKTLLAYSAISHTGYLLLSFSTGNLEGLEMMFYYLVVYTISGLCFWSVYLFLRQKRNSYFNKSNKELGDLVLLNESNPMLSLILAITLFSMAGIPPIVGFLAKLGIFLVVVKSSAYLVALVSILFSVIATFYYIRVIKILYFENVLVGKLYMPITTEKSLIISVLALLLIILCIDPMIIYLLFYKATLLIS
uniref:NADH dehydrogenase subunit 2 n=1 Tax=Nitzschia sp. PL1-4 TaxID=2083272 RepID=A0A2Z5ZB44_9STRA|nr:NADH dehydrogenase subunit 2 [Nitzschia sp. PL1-4]